MKPGRLAGLLLIVRRSLRQHALSTVVTVCSVALGIGLVMAVFVLSAQSRQAFAGGKVGFDAVLGARGSQLQLVLNTVFHLETSPGNIPWTLYEAVRKDPRVELAIPYAVGDNYKSFRIVGTSDELFTEFEYQEGKPFAVQPGGRFFDAQRREAVIGSTVAERIGLRVGDSFNAYHGIVHNESQKHDAEYVVVGVLEPTSSPTDRVIWIPIEGIFRMDGHVLRGSGRVFKPKAGESIAAEHKEVSAVMLRFTEPRAGAIMSQMINNQGKEATLAWPIATVMAQVFEKLGWVTRVLELVAYLVVVVAAGSILASIYNTMNERRREFAILRALGASGRTVFGVIVLEATVIATLGSLVGFAVYWGVLTVAATIVRAETGVLIEVATFHPALIWTPVGMIVLGAMSGLLPAFKAYSTDVAENLLPAS